MSLWSKLTGADSATNTTSRTPRDRARRNREIRAIDANTTRWLRSGGLAPKKGR